MIFPATEGFSCIAECPSAGWSAAPRLVRARSVIYPGSIGLQRQTFLLMGKNLLFYEWGMAVSGVPHAFLRTTDGSQKPIPLGEGRALALSPDQKWALTLQTGSAQQLALVPIDTGNPILLPRGDIRSITTHHGSPMGNRSYPQASTNQVTDCAPTFRKPQWSAASNH
jgi:hypothetical protein